MALNIVNNTMGYSATWTPAAGGETQTAIVLLNKPTETDKITDQEYDAMEPKCEYKCCDFIGFFEAVRDNVAVNQILIINGISYACYRAEKKFDGKTIIMTMQEQP